MYAVFFVPGKPVPKARPRASIKRKSKAEEFYEKVTGEKIKDKILMRTDEQTRQYEDDVRWSFKASNGGLYFKGYVHADILAVYPIPASASKKTKELMRQGRILPTVKPDSDNIAKIILDALNRVAYDDDSCVTELEVRKIYGDDPKVRVRLESISMSTLRFMRYFAPWVHRMVRWAKPVGRAVIAKGKGKQYRDIGPY